MKNECMTRHGCEGRAAVWKGVFHGMVVYVKCLAWMYVVLLHCALTLLLWKFAEVLWHLH
jgi:hypothetical protein